MKRALRMVCELFVLPTPLSLFTLRAVLSALTLHWGPLEVSNLPQLLTTDHGPGP